MPRQPRIDLPGIAQHLVQRGNDRQPCFHTDSDYLCYRDILREIAQHEGCAVHAYVQMTNHVHLLVTPTASGQIARVMQALGRRYVRYFNDRYRRTGTLWEGRYKACLVGDAAYLLRCQRYIELNPVRAGMVADPAEHPWSSHGRNAMGRHDPLVQPHPDFLALESDAEARRRSWRALVISGMDPDETEAIRLQLRRQHVYGSEGLRAYVEARSGRSAGPRRIGRPARVEQPVSKESRL